MAAPERTFLDFAVEGIEEKAEEISTAAFSIRDVLREEGINVQVHGLDLDEIADALRQIAAAINRLALAQQ